MTLLLRKVGEGVDEKIMGGLLSTEGSIRTGCWHFVRVCEQCPGRENVAHPDVGASRPLVGLAHGGVGSGKTSSCFSS